MAKRLSLCMWDQNTHACLKVEWGFYGNNFGEGAQQLHIFFNSALKKKKKNMNQIFKYIVSYPIRFSSLTYIFGTLIYGLYIWQFFYFT